MISTLFGVFALLLSTSSFSSFSLVCPCCDDCDDHHEVLGGIREMEDTYDFSMQTYFENLTTYSPVNLGDSCGFVSLCQYLSYYDCFRNDLFVPKAYERKSVGLTTADVLSNSPGVQRMARPNNLTMEEFVNANKNDDFQCKLIDIHNSIHSFNEYTSSIGMWDYQGILDYLYGSSTITFSYHQWWDYGNSPHDDSVRQQMKSLARAKINSGEPVVIHYTNGGNSSNENPIHSVVGYKVDSNNKIHAHFGWDDSSTDYIVGESEDITHVGYADVSGLSLTHSNNYVVNGLKYCGCGLHAYHSFSYYQISSFAGYSSDDSLSDSESELRYLPNMHRAVCNCGYQTNQLHFRYSSTPLNRCAGCGAISYSCVLLEEPIDD